VAKKWVTISPQEIALLEDVNSRDPDKSLTGLIQKFTKTQTKITTSSAKAKGRHLQQWVCDRISAITEIPYAQQDDQCEIHSREMGQAGIDVVLRGEALRRFPFSVECKASESLDIKGTVEQARGNVYKDTDWLIVHRRKAIPEVLVIMAWDAFERLVKCEKR